MLARAGRTWGHCRAQRCSLPRRAAIAYAVAAVLVFGLSARVVASAASAPTPESEGYQIYSKAIAAWAAMAEPPYLAYRVTTRARHHGRILRAEALRVLFRTADRTGVTQNLANSAAANATTFGRPRYLPDVAFRLVPRVAGTFDANLEAPPAPETTTTPLTTIGRVVVRTKRYAVDLVGEERYHDRLVYHLRLTPLLNPTFNSVREMWVDAETFVTWKLIDEASYGVGPARGRFLLNVEYGPIGRAWLIERVTTSGALRFGFIAYGGDIEVVFSEIAAPTAIADACFTPHGFHVHQADCNAAFL